MSSPLTHVTVVPGATVSIAGEKVKLSMRTSMAAAAGRMASMDCACTDGAWDSIGSARPPATRATPPEASARSAARARTRLESVDMARSPMPGCGVAERRFGRAQTPSPLGGWRKPAGGERQTHRLLSADQGRIDDGEGLAALDEFDRRHAEELAQLACRNLHGPR